MLHTHKLFSSHCYTILCPFAAEYLRGQIFDQIAGDYGDLSAQRMLHRQTRRIYTLVNARSIVIP